MYDLIKLIHLVAGIVWMGGMTFMLMALRPAALAVMEAHPRARLMEQVWQRFFNGVIVAIVALLATGGHLYTRSAGSAPLGWSVMAALGVTMVLIFGHIYFAGFKKFKRSVTSGEWPAAAQAAGQIHTLVLTNFVLGWIAIVAVRLVH